MILQWYCPECGHGGRAEYQIEFTRRVRWDFFDEAFLKAAEIVKEKIRVVHCSEGCSGTIFTTGIYTTYQKEKTTMPLFFNVTESDMLRSKVLAPGWYTAKIDKVSQEVAKSDGESMNTWVDLTVTGGPTQKDGGTPEKTPLRRCFSEKAPAFIVPFLKAVGATVAPTGGQFDIEKAVGREVKVYVKNREWEGKLQNDVVDFMAK